MLASLRQAKGAGYRAGRSGASYQVNPFRNQRKPLLSTFWGDGWEKGIKERIAEPLPFIVEMETARGWENVWSTNDEPDTFTSAAAALEAIEAHIEECALAVDRGHMQPMDAPIMQDFRVRQLGREFYE